MVVHALVRFFGRAFAPASLQSEQAFGGGKQRPAETIFATVLVGRIYKILGNDMARHLKSGDVAVELTAHIRSNKTTGSAQVACYHAAVLLQGSEDDSLNAAFVEFCALASAPVVQVGPPLATDKTCLASEELAIHAVAFPYGIAFPLPERPFPAAVVELCKTAVLVH